MSNENTIFHVAIPCRAIEETKNFYTNVIGAHPARRYEDRITFDFFGFQLVCHLAPDKISKMAAPYPRHFGVTFRNKTQFDELVQRLEMLDIEFMTPVSIRFEGRREEHLYIFLKDPSNNVLEFKYYLDPTMMY